MRAARRRLTYVATHQRPITCDLCREPRHPQVHHTHKARTLANGNVGRGSGLVCVCGPGQGVGVDLRIEEHLEGPVVLDAQLVGLVDEDFGEERLVAQPPVGVVYSVSEDTGRARQRIDS